MADHSLLDRMYREMRESERAWSADDLGRTFLKLTSGPLAASLVRRMLDRDERFTECEPGTWIARQFNRPRLENGDYLIAWLETGPGPADLRAHLSAWSAGTARGLSEPLLGTDPDRWISVLRTHPSHRWTAWQAGALHRLLLRLDRDFAIGEADPPPLDLLSFARLALALEGVGAEDRRRLLHLPLLADHWQLGPLPAAEDGPPLSTLVAMLEHLLERHGGWTAEELRAEAESVLSLRPVSFTGYDFGPEDLGRLPAAPGIYRFYAADGTLLYVGKSGRLDRRVSSYFRPLPQEPSQREELLGDLVRFDWEGLPSELEARLRESEEIRHRHPRRNVQLKVHPPDTFPPDFFWPLLFVAPGEDPIRRTVLLLEGEDRGYLLHVERDAPPDPALVEWLEGRLGERAAPARPESDDIVRPHALEPPEVWLALRYWLARRDEIPRVDPLSIVSGADAVRALVTLV